MPLEVGDVAASVWSALPSIRFFAERMPYFTSGALSSARPIAKAHAPTVTFAGSRKVATGSPVRSIFRSARPAARSIPSSFAAVVVPSPVVTATTVGFPSKFHAEVTI
jgi:hypothetical protein